MIGTSTLLLLVTMASVGPGETLPEQPSAEPAPEPPAVGTPCALEPREAAWLQRALDAWQRVTGEILEIPAEPLPWIVTFDETCAWHVAAPEGLPEGSREVSSPLTFSGSPVPVRTLPHDGTVGLPSGSEVPARAMAFASVWDEGRSTFFVLAMRSLWMADRPETREHDLDDFFLGVASHEMVHTRQLVEMARRVEALQEERERCTLPEDVGDTTIDELFADRPELAAMRERERDLLYEAAAAADPSRRRELTVAALDMIRERRERLFTGEASCYGELEDLFLVLEGTATWAHYRLARVEPGVAFLPEHPELTDRDRILELIRGKNGEWVQEAGFVLFLLLDEVAPDWRDRVLGQDLPSPIGLLGEALAAPPDPR